MLGALIAMALLAPLTTSLKRPIYLYLPNQLIEMVDFNKFTSITAPAFDDHCDLSVSLSICLYVCLCLSVLISLSSSDR